jgi:hypothetical protein
MSGLIFCVPYGQGVPVRRERGCRAPRVGLMLLAEAPLFQTHTLPHAVPYRLLRGRAAGDFLLPVDTSRRHP